MGSNYATLAPSRIAEAFEWFLKWGVVFNDRELPLDGETHWVQVPIPPEELLEELAYIGDCCNSEDLEWFVVVNKKPRTRHVPWTKTKKGRKTRDDQIVHYVDVWHLSFNLVGDKMGMSRTSVRTAYVRRKKQLKLRKGGVT